MNDSLFSAAHGYEWAAALIAAPAGAYIGLYCLFRCWGKLRVNASGWHAAGFGVGSLVIASAAGLFRLYQPLLRGESALARGLARLIRSERTEQPVSDVVVEFVVL